MINRFTNTRTLYVVFHYVSDQPITFLIYFLVLLIKLPEKLYDLYHILFTAVKHVSRFSVCALTDSDFVKIAVAN